MSYEIIEQLKKAIDTASKDAKWEEVGRVVQVGDGVARIQGLPGARAGEMLSIGTHSGARFALVLNLEEEMIGALILGTEESVSVGDVVKSTNTTLSLPVGEEMLGRVVNPLGEEVDGLGKMFKGKPEYRPLENAASGVLERESVNTPLHTGIKSIDAMIPIGRGQRELIIGDRQTGKTAIALDTIINQQYDEGRQKPVCIYVAIGQKDSKIAQIVGTLREKGAMDYTIVVSAPASSPAAFWYLAPLAGAAIGEYFMSKGQDALVVYDDLSKHAWAYRQISLLLNRPPGREAYPGDVFYLHSRLLERAAKLSKEKGGGSLTALPIIETQLGDISAYVPTNVISITDGQIFLESDLFYQGVRPAVNVGLSVSRVGSAAQTKAMKKIAGRLRLELAQFRELQAFVQFASDVDEATAAKIRRGEVLVEVLKQDDQAPLPFQEQVVVLWTATNGYFDGLARATVKEKAEEYMKHVRNVHKKDVLNALAQKQEITKEIEEAMKKAADGFDFNK